MAQDAQVFCYFIINKEALPLRFDDLDAVYATIDRQWGCFPPQQLSHGNRCLFR